MFVDNGVVWARMQPVTVQDDPSGWYQLGEEVIRFEPYALLDEDKVQ